MRHVRRYILNYLKESKSVSERQLKLKLQGIYNSSPEQEVDSDINNMLELLKLEKAIVVDDKKQISLSQRARKKLEEHEEFKKLHKDKKMALTKEKMKIKNKKLVSLERHEELKNNLGQLAHFFGYMWKPEYDLAKARKIKIDIVWYRKFGAAVSHAFEVQHRGDWKNAIGNLESIRRYAPDCKLYLVVDEEKEITAIKTFLGVKLDTSIEILSTQQLEVCNKTLGKLSDYTRNYLMTAVKQLI